MLEEGHCLLVVPGGMVKFLKKWAGEQDLLCWSYLGWLTQVGRPGTGCLFLLQWFSAWELLWGTLGETRGQREERTSPSIV